MINYLKSLLYSFIFILGALVIVTIFNYFNILKGTTFDIIKVLIPLLGVLIGSFNLGKSSNKKGYIEGLKYSFIFIVIFLVLNIVFNSFNYTDIIYYIILILVSMVGSILGINRKNR